MIESMGGETGCQRLSAAFYTRVAGDSELRPLFPGKSFRCATEEMSAFLIQFLGGDEQMTQYRWWLSLRESHARFKITELQRTAWLRQMEAALRSTDLGDKAQEALLQFFVSSSSYLVAGQGEPVKDAELAERWTQARQLDDLAANIAASNDDAVLQSYLGFSSRPSLFVGILAKMLKTGRTPLVQAVTDQIAQRPAIAEYRSAGRALLHYAAGAGCLEIVTQLLDIGCDPNILDTGKHSPLYRLANGCSADTGPVIARMLVDAGAEVNHCGGASRATALHMAARRGHVEIARTLLYLGASAELRDTKGDTPLDRAMKCRKPEVVQLLREIK